MARNPEWANVRRSVIAAGAFAVSGGAAVALVDGMSGGFALGFAAFFLTVSSLAVAVLFVHRARVLDDVLADPEPLARWVYPDAMVQSHVDREYRDFRDRNRALFVLVGAMLLVTALVFVFFVDDGGPLTGAVLIGVAVLVFVVSRATPGIERRRALKAPHESIITRRGIVHEGTVYPFTSFLVVPGGVSLRPADGGQPAALVFAFTQLTGGRIVQEFEVVVPVPPGEEERARWVVTQFGA